MDEAERKEGVSEEEKGARDARQKSVEEELPPMKLTYSEL